MSRSGLLDRVKSWFGVVRRQTHRRVGMGANPHPAGAAANPGLLLAAAGPGIGKGADAAPGVLTAPRPRSPLHGQPGADSRPTAVPEPASVAAGSPAPPAGRSHDAPEAELVRLLEALPDRLAESVATSAAGTKTLGKIGRELEGHRDTTHALANAVGRLPNLATDQVALTKRTHELLAEQTRLAEALVDGLTGLGAALKSVEESAQRHLACIAHLEATHRQVLEVYQSMLLKTHQRLGRLAALAAFLASAALGGAAYAIYLTLVQ